MSLGFKKSSLLMPETSWARGEDNGPARIWLSLIRKTLNSLPENSSNCQTPSPVPNPIVELDDDFEGSNGAEPSSFFHRRSLQSLSRSMRMTDNDVSAPQPRLQMVGIFLTVWIKSDLRDDLHNLKVSCVGRGLLGYLGNKGSISISLSLHQTSFCFICSHLTSGEKDGDELRRNSDVIEILRKTRFPRLHGTGFENSPQTILDHEGLELQDFPLLPLCKSSSRDVKLASFVSKRPEIR